MTTPGQGITRILAITRTVTDLAAAAQFYGEAVGFEPSGPELEISPADRALLGLEAARVRMLRLHLGSQHIVLLQVAPEGRPYPPGSTASDLWFQHCAIVTSDITRAHERAVRAGAVPITEGGPQRLPANTGGVTAFKFRDPFGHPLELLDFPPNVGNPAWHVASPPLTLGIDHTAIAVSDRDGSCQFYTKVLGLDVDDRSHNQGPAQTRLDAVPDDDVDVVALVPATAPPHLELLAYRTGTRRPLGSVDAADAAVSFTIATGDVDTIASRLRRYGTSVRHGTWEGRPAITFHDPDRHAWMCQQA